MDIFLQQNINAISLGAIYALFALGYAMVFSILGVLNLAHSAIFMWGAFVGLLALDPEKAPILITFYIVAIPLVALALLIEYAHDVGIQAMMRRIRGRQMRQMIALGVRILYIVVLAYGGKLLFEALLPQLPPTIHIPPMIALLLASFSSGVLSIALEFVAFRPLRERNADRLAQLISSIGAALILVNVAQFAFQAIYGRTEAYYPQDISLLGISTEPIVIEGLRIAPIRLVILVIALMLMIALRFLVQDTRVGQQMRAVAFNEKIASLLGIDVSRVYILTFFLAGAFGGIAGILFGMTFLNVTPFVGDSISLLGLTAIVLGGLGSIPGSLVGGFIVAYIQTFSVAYVSSSFRDAIVFALLFLVLLVRPQGLFGQAKQNRA